MKRQSVRRYLKPYSIRQQRATTIRHAFASSLAAHDVYDDAAIRSAIADLKQDPDGDLICVYCGKLAACWDHLNAIVRKGRHSGHGHTIRNLVPACRDCNEKKGNQDWRIWIAATCSAPDEVARRIEAYIAAGSPYQATDEDPDARRAELLRRHEEIRDRIIGLFAEADTIAKEFRELGRASAR
ncbi:MAG: HNH endonuclease [Alphaproteobacteria bacterium]|nr:HNH endonuclease [Alphaproteobacteria bacterium]